MVIHPAHWKETCGLLFSQKLITANRLILQYTIAQSSCGVGSTAATFNESNQALISEYKEKIDTLSGLVTKYKDFA